MDTSRFYVIYFRDTALTEVGSIAAADIQQAWGNLTLPNGADLRPSGRKVSSCMRIVRTTESLGTSKITEAVGIVEAPEGTATYKNQWADVVADNFTGAVMNLIPADLVTRMRNVDSVTVRPYSAQIDASPEQIEDGSFCRSTTSDRFPGLSGNEHVDEDPLRPDTRQLGNDWWKFGLGIGVAVVVIGGIGAGVWYAQSQSKLLNR